jgi:Tfp pilus assembly protein PilN
MFLQLNLLPPEKKKVLTDIFYILYSKVMVEVLLGYSLIIAVTLFLASYTLSQNMHNFKEQTASIDREYQKINQQVVQINEELARIYYVRQTTSDWSNRLASFFNLNPVGVTLTGVDWSPQSRSFTIRGKAKSRDEFLRYKSELEGLPYLSNIQTPISTLIAKENIDFSLSAELGSK